MKFNLEFVETEIVISAAQDGRFPTIEKLKEDVVNLQKHYRVDAVRVNDKNGACVNFDDDDLAKVVSLLIIPAIKPLRNRDQDSIKDYSCPECSSTMENGYVTSNHSIRWAKDKSEGNYIGVNAETLTPFSLIAIKNPKCIGLRCRDCGIVLFKEWQIPCK